MGAIYPSTNVSIISTNSFAADENAWRSDEEFTREMLAGLNPAVIKCLEVRSLGSPKSNEKNFLNQ